MTTPPELTIDDARGLDNTADCWERGGLPNFQVQGLLDGKPVTWSMPELLRLTARRIRRAHEARLIEMGLKR